MNMSVVGCDSLKIVDGTQPKSQRSKLVLDVASDWVTDGISNSFRINSGVFPGILVNNSNFHVNSVSISQVSHKTIL